MGIPLYWSRLNDNGQVAPRLQTFEEKLDGARFPLQTMPDANVTVYNVVPGRAYRIDTLRSYRESGEPWSTGMSTNDFQKTFYWPVSDMSATPFTRESLIANIDYFPHFSRFADDHYAVRVVTRPPSEPLNGNFEMSFGVFLEANIETLTVTVGRDPESNLLTFYNAPEYVELGYEYTFDNSSHHTDLPIQLVNSERELLVSADPTTGVLTFTLDDPALLGNPVYVISDQLNTSPAMTVRDGRGKRTFTELGNLSFSALFSDGFRTHVFEVSNVDTSYALYDAFFTTRLNHDLYVTSHMYAHTVRMRTYAPPTRIEISDFQKTGTNRLRFEYPNHLTVGLVFRLTRDVSLRDMYQRILYGS